jgi:uncharacterized metal-binding protein YceD (DUF177 family)
LLPEDGALPWRHRTLIRHETGLQKVAPLFKKGTRDFRRDRARRHRPDEEAQMPETDPVALPYSYPLRVAGLAARKPTRFDLSPLPEERAALAALLGITAIHALRFKGELRPMRQQDYELEARLEAQVEQPCVITLAPVLTELSEPVRRRYLRDYSLPEGDEAEMPEDDSEEPLPAVIDLGAVIAEALALALPDYPHAPGAELGEAVFTEPGQAALRDADLRPFAGLAALVRKDDPPEGH